MILGQFVEPPLIAVQEIVGQITLLFEEGNFQAFGGLVGGQVLINEGGKEGVGRAGVPDGHQAAHQGGEDQGPQKQKNPGPQADILSQGFQKSSFGPKERSQIRSGL